LTNAARQSQIYDALGWIRPVFSHVPLIHGPDGKKLSKRHGALGVEAYRDMGYLPEGLRNYLLRLGWSKGDQEYFTDAEARKAFNLDGLNKSPARLDFDKMASVNSIAMKAADDGRLVGLLIHALEKSNSINIDTRTLEDRLTRAMPLLKTRANTLVELGEQSYFLYRTTPISIKGKAAKSLDDDAKLRLGRLRDVLATASDWTEANLSDLLKNFAEHEGVGFGKVGQPLRAALTGGAPAPDLSAALVFLGKTESIERISEQAT